jgi:hypothetical protein
MLILHFCFIEIKLFPSTIKKKFSVSNNKFNVCKETGKWHLSIKKKSYRIITENNVENEKLSKNWLDLAKMYFTDATKLFANDYGKYI